VDKLIYQTSPRVTIATNHFFNVPVILQYDDTPLISVIREESLGFTTEVPVFHSDGTYLAKVRGTRVYPTGDGVKAGINMRYPAGMTVCELDGRTLFEVYHETGDAFRMHAELHTPTGYLIKCTDSPVPELITAGGDALRAGGIQMSGCSFENLRIGIWMRSDGSIAVGCG